MAANSKLENKMELAMVTRQAIRNGYDDQKIFSLLKEKNLFVANPEDFLKEAREEVRILDQMDLSGIADTQGAQPDKKDKIAKEMILQGCTNDAINAVLAKEGLVPEGSKNQRYFTAKRKELGVSRRLPISGASFKEMKTEIASRMLLDGYSVQHINKTLFEEGLVKSVSSVNWDFYSRLRKKLGISKRAESAASQKGASSNLSIQPMEVPLNEQPTKADAQRERLLQLKDKILSEMAELEIQSLEMTQDGKMVIVRKEIVL